MLATVKSYLGSEGVKPESVMGEHPKHSGGYRLLNDPDARSQVLRGIRERFGYEGDQIEVRLYTGKIAGGARYSARNEERIRQWCARQTVGSGPLLLLTLPSVASRALELSTVTEYRDNPALVAIKVLRAAGLLAEPDTAGSSQPGCQTVREWVCTATCELVTMSGAPTSRPSWTKRPASRDPTPEQAPFGTDLQ